MREQLHTIFRGDIVWVNNNSGLDTSIQLGKRPYLIISNNYCNKYSPVITAIPLTSKEKKSLPMHHTIMLDNVINTVLAEQITCISKSNITDYIDTIGDKDLKIIETKIKLQLGLK